MAYTYSRPAPGTLTRRVWDIADEETRQSGQLAKRQHVIERAIAEGANQNTASTQYHHWRKHAEDAPRGRELSAVDASSYLSLDVREAGRVLLPADVRMALGVKEGDELVGELIDGELRLMSRDTAVRKAQELVRNYVPEGVSLVDQLIAERRAESRREEADAVRTHSK